MLEREIHLGDTAYSDEGTAASMLRTFELAGVRCCLWKSQDRWPDSITGKTDIDLLVAPRQTVDAFACLESAGWIPLRAESWRSFPGVFDFAKFDPGVGAHIHMHLHTRLVTGEKLIKSLSPPWVDLYLEHSIDDPWPPHVDPHIEFIMFLLRLCLKLTWIDYARIVRRRDFSMLFREFRGEYEELRGRCKRHRVAEFLDEPVFTGIDRGIILDAFDDLDSLTFARRRRLRRAIHPYRRMGPVKRHASNFWRARLRNWTGVGKRLPGPGLSFAVCGSDGSGKTTLCDAVQEALSAHYKMTRIYMGGNLQRPGFLRGIIMRSLWPFYLVIRKLFKLTGWKRGVRAMEYGYFGFDGWLLAFEKRGRSRRGRQAVAHGHLVLYERFPAFEGYGDGVPDNPSVLVTPGMRAIYEAIPQPDLIFVIDLPAEVAKARRPEDPPSVIEGKVAAFHRFATASVDRDDVVVLNGDHAVAGNTHRVLEIVDRALANRGYRFNALAGQQ